MTDTSINREREEIRLTYLRRLAVLLEGISRQRDVLVADREGGAILGGHYLGFVLESYS